MFAKIVRISSRLTLPCYPIAKLESNCQTVVVVVVGMPLFRVRQQKLTLEMAETHMRRMRGAWGFEFCRPFPVPGKLGFFYVHTRSVHGAACLTTSSDGRRTRRYPKRETGKAWKVRLKSPSRRWGSNHRPSDREESALSTRPNTRTSR